MLPMAEPAEPPEEPRPPTAAPMLTDADADSDPELPPDPPPPPMLVIDTAGEYSFFVVIDVPLNVADAVLPLPPALPEPPTDGAMDAAPTEIDRLEPPEPPPPPIEATLIPGD